MDSNQFIASLIGSGILGAIISYFFNRKEKTDDKKELVCGEHTKSINDLHVRLTVVENKLDTHDDEIKELKDMLIEIQKDIKTLLQRL